MNKVTLALTGAALALGAAIPTYLVAFYHGASEMETVVATPPVCTVQDQELAEHRRAVEIGNDIEGLIETKVRLLGEVGSLKIEAESLKNEHELLTIMVKDQGVFIEQARASLKAAKKASAFELRGVER